MKFYRFITVKVLIYIKNNIYFLGDMYVVEIWGDDRHFRNNIFFSFDI